MEPAQTRVQSLAAIAQGRTLYTRFNDDLTDAQRTAEGTFVPYSAWSAKDLLGHCTFWSTCVALRWEASAINAPIPDFEDFNKYNEAQYQLRRAWTWDHVWTEAMDTLDHLTNIITGMSDAAIVKIYDNRTVTSQLFDNAISHPSWHIADYWLFRDNQSRAEALIKDVIQMTVSINGEEGRTTATYNLACFYARTDRAQEALALLPNVFQKSPGLKKWATEDTDLATLHNDPAFLALYVDADIKSALSQKPERLGKVSSETQQQPSET